MNLYNMMHGFDGNARTILLTLGIDPDSIARFRDAYADPENNEFVIMTRTGGGNRELYKEEKHLRLLMIMVTLQFKRILA